ncbi:biotin transporter BioY, partial [Candidatus Woesearchaeota archaeon]|nr:biotin transporter BioY [Candidatus Woesearchaeota archaeon]
MILMEPMEKKAIKGMVFAAMFAALTAAVSPVKIPLGFTPVPITLQTLMVLLS